MVSAAPGGFGKVLPLAGRCRVLVGRLDGDPADAPLAGGDLLCTGEHRKPRGVALLIAVLEPDQLATVLRERLPAHMARRSLDTDRVLALLEVLPLVLGRELGPAGLDHEADPAAALEAVVHDRYRNASIRVRHHFVLPHLLVKALLRPRQCAIPDVLGPIALLMRGPQRLPDWREITAALGEHRVTHVDVVQEH